MKPRRQPGSAPLLRPAAPLATLLVALACSTEPPAQGNGGSSAPPAPAPAPDSPAPDTASDPATPPPPAPADSGWTVGVVELPARLDARWPVPVIATLRTGSHPGFERLTLELAEGQALPEVHVEYIDRPLHQCGSGEQVFPVGDAWLEVRLEPAAAHTEAGAATLPGREIPVSGERMRRLYLTCDFEAVVSLVVAVDRPNPFRVFTLEDPARIVIDVRR